MKVKDYRLSLYIVLKHIDLFYSIDTEEEDKSKDVYNLYDCERRDLRANSFDLACDIYEVTRSFVIQDFFEVKDLSDRDIDYIYYLYSLDFNGNKIYNYYIWNDKIYSVLNNFRFSLEKEQIRNEIYIEKEFITLERLNQNDEVIFTEKNNFNFNIQNSYDLLEEVTECYEMCFIWYLSKVISIKETFDFLEFHSLYFNDKNEFIKFLESIIPHYKNVYTNVLHKTTVNQIKKWIKVTLVVSPPNNPEYNFESDEKLKLEKLKITQKLVILKELGVLDKMQEVHEFTSINEFAKYLKKYLGDRIPLSTVQDPLNKIQYNIGSKNNPLHTEANILLREALAKYLS